MLMDVSCIAALWMVDTAMPKRIVRGWGRSALCVGLSLCMLVTGCTNPANYFRNGCKVGPQYRRPKASVAPAWIDSADPRIVSCSSCSNCGNAYWWELLGDPVLSFLIESAYQQNLTVRAAGQRVLQARAQLDFFRGDLFPQEQSAIGQYNRIAESGEVANPGALGSNRYYDDWAVGGLLIWELDFWGRFRRAVDSAEALLDAEVEAYDDVLVILVADVASAYVDYRTANQRLEYARQNLEIQQENARISEEKFEAEATESQIDLPQAVSTLAETRALIPQLELDRRVALNRLSVLLGMPPTDLTEVLGPGEIPRPPAQLAIGIPADLLRQRPDVRQAERELAAQCEQIGIAVSDLYPHLTISGSIFWNADSFGDMFDGNALSGAVGPGFRWDLLNYGRLRANIRDQEARFNELLYDYQQSVLTANEEAENAVATYLFNQQRVEQLAEGADAAGEAVRITSTRYKEGVSGFNRLFNLQNLLTRQQDAYAVAQGDTLQGLIGIYRALGGGWQVRLGRPGGVQRELIPAPAPQPEELEGDENIEGVEEIDGAEEAIEDLEPATANAETSDFLADHRHAPVVESVESPEPQISDPEMSEPVVVAQQPSISAAAVSRALEDSYQQTVVWSTGSDSPSSDGPKSSESQQPTLVELPEVQQVEVPNVVSIQWEINSESSNSETKAE